MDSQGFALSGSRAEPWPRISRRYRTSNPAKIKFQPVEALIDQQTRNWALYGLGQYRITPTLTAFAGLRWNWEQHSNSETLSSLGPTAGTVIGQAGDLDALYDAPSGALDWRASARGTWTQLLPRGSLEWQALPRVMPYVTISQGGKSAGYDYRAQTPTALGRQQALLPYGPETVTTYELGVKSEPRAGVVRLNGALFYNDFTDLQITTLDPASGLSHRYNAGNAHSLGAELEASAHVQPGWEIDATGSYLDGELDSFKGVFSRTVYADGLAINNTPHAGERLPYSPRFQADLSSSYELPIRLPGRLRVAGDVSFQSPVFLDALDNTQTRLPDQTYVNALVGWTSPHGRWTATLAGKNLLDRRYPQSLTFLQGNGVPVLCAAAYADPRTLFFTLRYTL